MITSLFLHNLSTVYNIVAKVQLPTKLSTHLFVILDPINDTSTLIYLNYTKHPPTCLHGNSVCYTCEGKLSIERIFSSIVFDEMWESSNDSHQEPASSLGIRNLR